MPEKEAKPMTEEEMEEMIARVDRCFKQAIDETFKTITEMIKALPEGNKLISGKLVLAAMMEKNMGEKPTIH